MKSIRKVLEDPKQEQALLQLRDHHSLDPQVFNQMNSHPPKRDHPGCKKETRGLAGGPHRAGAGAGGRLPRVTYAVRPVRDADGEGHLALDHPRLKENYLPYPPPISNRTTRVRTCSG